MIIVSCYKPPFKPYRSDRYKVHSANVRTRNSYSYELQAAWNRSGSLINIEHDIEATDDRIKELLDCPCPCCTIPYLINPDRAVNVSTGEQIPTNQVGKPFLSIQGLKDDRCRFSAIGLIKLSKTHRSLHRLPTSGWWNVEYHINFHISSWHVHWPGVGHRGMVPPTIETLINGSFESLDCDIATCHNDR